LINKILVSIEMVCGDLFLKHIVHLRIQIIQRKAGALLSKCGTITALYCNGRKTGVSVFRIVKAFKGKRYRIVTGLTYGSTPRIQLINLIGSKCAVIQLNFIKYCLCVVACSITADI